MPVTRDFYFSEKKIGSYKINMSNFSHNFDKLIESSTKLPIDYDNKSYTIVASRSHMSNETEQFIKDKKKKYDNIELISRGSSLKLCMVAEGKAKCYPRYAPTMEWDTAAGHAICLNAGFNVIDYKTKKPMIYNRENLLNNWFIVE